MNEATGLAQVEAQATVVRGLVAGVEPDAVPLPKIPRMWKAFGTIARLAGAAQLLLARRVDESPVWKDEGCRSAAEYMARASGGSVRGAQDVLRASKKLDEVPVVEQALRRGELSVVQAEMVTDAAAHAPSKQSELVEAAGRLSLAELGQECGRIKAAADPDPDKAYERIRANRRLRQRTDGEGAWCLHGRGTVDDGALFEFVLGPLIDEMYDQARQEGRHEHRDAYMYDAFVELLHRYLDTEDDNTIEHDSEAPADGDTDHDGDAQERGADGDNPGERRPADARNGRRRVGKRRRRSRKNPRYMALLRIDVSALQRGHVEDGEVVAIAGLGPVPVSRARELLGDAIVKLVITKGVAVANVTNLGRQATAAQRVALLWQSPSCSNEACPHSFVQIDHRLDWANTHRTVLHALDPLCPHCHRLKTYEGWSLVDGVGKRPFVPPDDPRHPSNKKHRQTPSRPPHTGAAGVDAGGQAERSPVSMTATGPGTTPHRPVAGTGLYGETAPHGRAAPVEGMQRPLHAA